MAEKTAVEIALSHPKNARKGRSIFQSRFSDEEILEMAIMHLNGALTPSQVWHTLEQDSGNMNGIVYMMFNKIRDAIASGVLPKLPNPRS